MRFDARSNLSGGAELITSTVPPAVVVHAGARDGYQLAMAMSEGGSLQRLVTNVYRPDWARQRFGIDLRPSQYTVPAAAFASFCIMRATGRSMLNRFSDRVLGNAARRLAIKTNSALLSCSYYASSALDPRFPLPACRFLFQVHPHPRSVRRILLEELERTPIARESLLAEEELNRSPELFEQLAAEPSLANGIIVSSGFLASTLVENDIPADMIHRVTYGVNRTRYWPRTSPPRNRPFTAVWVGSISQRKGLTDFLDAIRLLRTRNIQIKIRGYRSKGISILSQYSDLNLDVRCSDPVEAVVNDMHESDVYVLPSLVEGFGHSILEAMSCGLPVITTPNTCAADFDTHDRYGFLVPIRRPDAIAQHLEWSLSNRGALAEMGDAASHFASTLTWAAFRHGVRQAYSRMSENLLKTMDCH